jgi:hypothetical protein
MNVDRNNIGGVMEKRGLKKVWEYYDRYSYEVRNGTYSEIMGEDVTVGMVVQEQEGWMEWEVTEMGKWEEDKYNGCNMCWVVGRLVEGDYVTCVGEGLVGRIGDMFRVEQDWYEGSIVTIRREGLDLVELEY